MNFRQPCSTKDILWQKNGAKQLRQDLGLIINTINGHPEGASYKEQLKNN